MSSFCVVFCSIWAPFWRRFVIDCISIQMSHKDQVSLWETCDYFLRFIYCIFLHAVVNITYLMLSLPIPKSLIVNALACESVNVLHVEVDSFWTKVKAPGPADMTTQENNGGARRWGLLNPRQVSWRCCCEFIFENMTTVHIFQKSLQFYNVPTMLSLFL